MSAIAELGVGMCNLPNILQKYENELASYPTNLEIKNKTLEFALREQATWSAYYGERAVELGILIKYLEVQIKKVRGKLTVTYNENYNPSLSERMTDKYIDREDEYLTLYEMYLEIKEVHEKYELVLDAFNRRGFALRDITLSRVHEIQGVTL